jgi:ectoine hydroxylase-related dioxygenase (phytanoyl-CoA dioxygenase family)
MTLEAISIANLGEDAHQRFDRDGFLILDDPCAPELLDALRSELEGMFKNAWDPGPHAETEGVMYDGPGRRRGTWHWHRIKNAWKISNNAREVALEPAILGLLETLYGRRVMPFQTLNFPVGTQQKAHADSFHFQSDPPGFMCGVWIALEDMDMENGPLVYYPGSHKLPIPTWPEIEAEMGEVLARDDYSTQAEFMRARSAQYERYCQRLIERESLEPEHGTIRKGQAVLWASNLLHGGSPQTDKTRTRHSQVTHYFFEGCRVYTPLHTQGGHNFWYYPEWIRDPVPVYSQQTLEETVAANIPEGARVLFMSDRELPGAGDRAMSPFPQNDAGQFAHVPDEHAIRSLEELRSLGARFLVVPKEQLQFLVYSMPTLQEHIEERYTPLVRDGSVCAIYALS